MGLEMAPRPGRRGSCGRPARGAAGALVRVRVRDRVRLSVRLRLRVERSGFNPRLKRPGFKPYPYPYP
jgi:hypothetical protein